MKSVLRSRPTTFRMIVVVTALLCGALVSTLVAQARQAASVEAEQGSLLGNVMTQAASNASSGNYIIFGTASSGLCPEGATITMNTCLRQATIPAPATGSNQARQYRETGYQPYIPHTNSDFAAFRTNCRLSHVSKNDPIVYPGGRDAAHWHIFFGNTAADENLTNPVAQGNSTCYGGSHNKTAYWAPALIDTNSYNPTTRMFDMAQVIPGDDPLQVYYKSGYEGVLASTVTNFPAGLRMIAGGNPNVTPTGPPGHRVRFDCLNSANAQDAYNGIYERDSIPANCPAGKYLQARVQFPQCGAVDANGNPILDSANHRSHMAYPLGYPDRGCPASHPRPYAEIIEHFRWVVPASGSAGLRFSSDMYDLSQPGGWTFHADWWNGWNQDTFQSILDTCYYPRHNGLNGSNGRGWDCQMNLFGRHPSGGYWGLDAPN